MAKKLPSAEKLPVTKNAGGSSISDAIQRIKARQQELQQQHEASQRMMYQDLKEREAAAVSQTPPELEKPLLQKGSEELEAKEEVSDADSNDGVVVEKKGLKRLFK